MKKSVVPLLSGIIFLILIGVQGTPMKPTGRCLCITTSNSAIKLRFLKELKHYAPTSSCEKTEIIAIMKNGKQTCLNPDSKLVQKLIKHWEKKVLKQKQKKGGKDKKSRKVQAIRALTVLNKGRLHK